MDEGFLTLPQGEWDALHQVLDRPGIVPWLMSLSIEEPA